VFQFSKIRFKLGEKFQVNFRSPPNKTWTSMASDITSPVLPLILQWPSLIQSATLELVLSLMSSGVPQSLLSSTRLTMKLEIQMSKRLWRLMIHNTFIQILAPSIHGHRCKISQDSCLLGKLSIRLLTSSLSLRSWIVSMPTIPCTTCSMTMNWSSNMCSMA